MNRSFTHLHVHSNFSFLDSTLSPQDIVALAKEQGMQSVALTDTNCMSGSVVFYKAAKAAGLKPILGAEVRQPFDADRAVLKKRAALQWELEEDELMGGETHAGSHSPMLSQGDPELRAVVLARSFAGYSEISRLVTARMLEEDFDLREALTALTDQVIVLTDSIALLRNIRRENVYAMLQPSRGKRRHNRDVYDLAVELGIPLAVACDVKLGQAQDAGLHNLLQAMRNLTTIYQLPQFLRIDSAQHFQTAEAVYEFFGVTKNEKSETIFSRLQAALSATEHIASLCECELPMEKWNFPELPNFENSERAARVKLRRLVKKGMHKRYGDKPTPEQDARMKWELRVIEKLGFSQYFLIVREIVEQAHSRGFFTVGRGSGANSIFSYVLEFTDVCPVKYKLYFERFLNEDRNVPPDIDIDFSWKDRDELIKWCFDYFGHDRVALICTIQTLQWRQAVREVAKAHGLSETEINTFSRAWETDFRIEERESNGKGCMHDLSKEEPWPSILEQAERILGFPRHLSIHCGGILITPGPVTNWVPLARSAKGFVITQMDMVSVEDLRLIKIDLLSNRSLGVLKDAVQAASNDGQVSLDTKISPSQPDHLAVLRSNPSVFQREALRIKLPGTRRGTSVALAGILEVFAPSEDSQSLPIETLDERVRDFTHITSDAATRSLIDQGLTMGCFYIESPGMRALFERLRCKNFEEVVVASSIIRPGVAESGMMQEYIVRHQDASSEGSKIQQRKVVKIHESMLKILPDTHGVMVYQEDVLKVVHEVAGMSLTEADIVRRAISGKMRSKDALLSLKDKFISGAIGKGLPQGDAEDVWRQMESFAGYSFCKGHSAAYAVLSYQVAYLKAHYPAEFFAAVLSNGGGFYGAGAYLEESRRWGLHVLSPCVNESELAYTGRTLDSVRAAREVFEGKRPGEPLGWLRIGLDAVAGLSADTKKGILAERERRGCFHCLQEFMERTGITLEPCRMLIKAGAMDDLAGISCEASFPEKLAARQELFLQAECTAHVQKWAGSDSFLPYDAPAGSAARVDAAKALRTLCEQEREALGFTVTAHPLDLVIVPPNVIPAKEIRNHDGKRVHMAGWQISAKLLATRNDGRTMKILTLEDRTDTFEASLFPNVYTRLAPRTLGKGPYLVEGIVDMSLGSPMLTVKDIKVL